MIATARSFGGVGSLGNMTWVTPAGEIWTRGLGSTRGFGAPNSGAVADFYGSGGFAYRVYGFTGTPTFQVVQAPKGNTLGKMVYAGTAAHTAILTEYMSASKAGRLRPANSIPQQYSGSSKPITGASSTTTADVSLGTSPNRAENTLNTFTTITNALTPLATGLASAFSGGALGLGGNDPAQIAATIARKERELALTPTSNAPKRARLQAEIQQLRQSQALYADTVQSGMSDLGLSGGEVTQPSGGASLLPVGLALVAGAAVIGGVAWLATR